MSPELEQKLADRFSFMRHRDNTNQGRCINDLYKAFGCECGDGWFQILWDLCTEIEWICNEYPTAPKMYITQIKEKYGKLNFYYGYAWWDCDVDEDDTLDENEMDKIMESLDGFYNSIDNIVSKYEGKSAETCEHCGELGEQKSDGWWISTLCDKCRSRINEGR